MSTPHHGRAAAAILALIVAVTAGCGPAPTTPPTLNLEATAWRVVQIGNRILTAGTEPTIVFRAGRAQGSTGCNTYGGDVAVVDGRLRFSELQMTLVLCLGERGDNEAAFVRIVGTNPPFGAVGANLAIGSGSDTLLLRPDPTVR